MITLKNIKVIKRMSHETECFTASVYIDGKKAGSVENTGQGGCHSYYPANIERLVAAFSDSEFEPADAAINQALYA